MEMYSSEYLRCVIEEYMTLIQKASQIVGIAIFPCTGFFTGKLQRELHRTLHITRERVLQGYERETSTNEYQCNRLFHPPAHGMDVHHV